MAQPASQRQVRPAGPRRAQADAEHQHTQRWPEFAASAARMREDQAGGTDGLAGCRKVAAMPGSSAMLATYAPVRSPAWLAVVAVSSEVALGVIE